MRSSAIELNLACPNIPGKPTIAYGTSLRVAARRIPTEPSVRSSSRSAADFEQMEEVLKAVFDHPAAKRRPDRPIGIKLCVGYHVPS